ncbi:TIGR03086 family metal-binding protein [Aquihabitans daechungensis]|uniref:TIGR03086 family metal-binding protein n=1 Tax=Aquihabitans daechungensis TaxID=1052257 RepID=UPI003BA3139E
MTVTPGTVFLDGLDFCGGVVRQLGDADWDRPSPCEGWTARDVLGHLTTSMNMGLSLFAGEEPTWPEVDRPADLVDGDPAAVYADVADRCRAAFDGADLDVEMDTPMGKRTVADRLAFPAIDLYVHAWDIGTAAGIDVEIPDEVVAFAHESIDPFPEEVVRGPKGAFGPQAEVPGDASLTEQFVAWTGREPRPGA